MKRIITLMLCFALLFAVAIPVSAEGTIHLSISAGSGSAYRGDTVTFNVYASGGGTCNTLGLALSYDTSVYEFAGGSVSVSGASLADFGGGVLAVIYQTPGSPSGTVATFKLRVKSSAPFGTFGVSGRASAEGASISASGTSVTVVCNHSYGEWNKYSQDYHQKICSICGGSKEEIHAWNEGTVTKTPSCKEEGSKTYTCTVCGEMKDEVLGKTDDHNYSTPEKVDDTNHKSTCNICSGDLVAAHNWNKTETIKKETCKETGIKRYTCTACGASYEETIPLSEVHKYSAWTKVDDDKHTHKCSVCDKEETVDHTWNNGSVTKKPNCVDTGTCLYTCTGCGLTKTEELPVTGVHTYDHGCDKDCNVCSATRSTSHTYSSTWSKNADQHWKTCSSCGDKAELAEHTPGPEATEFNPQLCTVCEYILHPELAHEHKYAEEFTTDEEGHWYPCAGCEEQKDYALHDFENGCDGLCETCGYTRETSHDISEEWFTNAATHFQKCLSCDQEEEHIPHSPGPAATELEPQLCEICGYELAPALGHSFAEEWSCDSETHYHKCKCGEKTDIAAHTYNEGVRESGGTRYTCTVCGFEKFESRNLTWLAFVAAGVAVAGAAVIVILLKKKKI